MTLAYRPRYDTNRARFRGLPGTEIRRCENGACSVCMSLAAARNTYAYTGEETRAYVCRICACACVCVSVFTCAVFTALVTRSVESGDSAARRRAPGGSARTRVRRCEFLICTRSSCRVEYSKVETAVEISGWGGGGGRVAIDFARLSSLFPPPFVARLFGHRRRTAVETRVKTDEKRRGYTRYHYGTAERRRARRNSPTRGTVLAVDGTRRRATDDARFPRTYFGETVGTVTSVG